MQNNSNKKKNHGPHREKDTLEPQPEETIEEFNAIYSTV